MDKKSKILVVDDIPEYLDVIEVMLSEKFDIEKAKTLKEAMEKTEEIKPDIAVVDVRLNEEDESNKEGLEFLKWIKKNYPTIPVIMISAYKEFEFRAESLSLGAEYFLEKPINIKNFIDVINKVYGKKK